MARSGKRLKRLSDRKGWLVCKKVQSFFFFSFQQFSLCNVSLMFPFSLTHTQLGLIPALAFQFVMNSTRLGLYETVDQLNWTRFSPQSPHSTLLCVLWGAASGVAGSAVGCPLYMVKTQLQGKKKVRCNLLKLNVCSESRI